MSNESSKTSNPGDSNRRSVKNYLLSPQRQMLVAIQVLITGFTVSCVFFAAFMYTTSMTMENLARLAPEQFEAAAIVTSAKHDMLIVFLLFLLISILSSLFLAVRITHTYVGPQVPAKRFIAALTEGRKPEGPLTLRKHDQFMLQDDLNALGKKLYPDL